MSSFPKNLQKFFVYFFTSASVLVVILGIQRVKQGDSLSITPSPKGNDGASGDTGTTLDATSSGNAQTIVAKGKGYQTPWGTLATTIRVKDGKVIAVEIPQLPDSPPSVYAKPYLIDQVLRSGGANIQGVSGATITSRAFKASIESALAQAASQGATVTRSSSSGSLADTITTPPSAPIQEPSIVAPTITRTTSPSTSASSSNASGTFTGDAYQTPWGNAVASVTFTNGKITGVTMPQVPNSPPSIQAKPYLIDQALAAGGANIQGVSGATYASIAFKSSLESAIAKASAQGTVATPTATQAQTATQTQTAKPSIPRTYRDDDRDNEGAEEWDD